ncbi:MAG: ParA family protein [Gammaproteobacteria bacterium]|nr:ParA family protein [Gammaproteobacteria bacterium]MBT5406297.1 ParA family protein [Gammaproteobacteria bacterium]MBT5643852.1 ParA family protein [Gammaproteobacteria bacterium]MBT5862893.1 ParA family protein [Gammaproteobacteria bacterium]|tara:strand:- start:1545 stop:2312 length:768 start_codon:yes stop_codon:yes gene_type:complete
MTELLAVVNQKGGVGKTTSCINICASLAKTKRKTLLIDLDPQSNATRGCGIDPHGLTTSINDVLLGRTNIDESIISTDNISFSILPATPELTESEVMLLSSERKEYTLKNVLVDCESKFDYILIDCPPSLNILTVNALTASTGVLIPVQCEFFALQGLTELMTTIDTIKSSSNPSLLVKGIIRTMFDPRNNLATDVSAQLLKFFDDKLYRTIIPRNITLAEAPSHGLPVLEYDKTSKGALSYLSLTGEILKQEKL